MRDEKLYSVNTIPLEYKRLFGRDADIFEVIELLPIVLRSCNSVPPEYIFISDTVKDNKLILPCVYYSVKYAVTPFYDDYYQVDHIIKNGQGILVNYDLDSWRGSILEANQDVVVNQVPAKAVKVNESFPRYPRGKYIDYKARGNIMEFQYDNVPVHVLLTVMPVDEKGYPKITEKVITAMAYFMNMVYIQKKYYSAQVPQYLFHDAKADYDQKIGEAITPDMLSDNEINDIMNALSTYHRHQYNQPFRA